jgi:hypothetical protein
MHGMGLWLPRLAPALHLSRLHFRPQITTRFFCAGISFDQAHILVDNSIFAAATPILQQQRKHHPSVFDDIQTSNCLQQQSPVCRAQPTPFVAENIKFLHIDHQQQQQQ